MTIKPNIVHIGVDVSKKHLDLSPFDKGPRRIPNTPAGRRKLIRRIQALQSETIVTCEASGGYEQALLEDLLDAEIPVARVNPNQVRYFVRSQGVGAKNDRIDAAMLSRFGEFRHGEGRLFLALKSEEGLADLRGLLQRRSQLKAAIRQEKNRLDPSPCKLVASHIRSHIKYLEKSLAKIEGAMKEWEKEHPVYKELRKRLLSVKGIGRITVLTLLAFMPELGKVSDRRLSALVGVAPYDRQSGDSQMQSKIAGGRVEVRRVMYMAALAAGRSNPILRAFKERLVAQGKAKKLVLIAILRKLVVLANKIAANPDFKPA